MSRIKNTFIKLAQQGRKGLIPFITAGDPGLDATVQLMHALVKGGADIIELGVPFSDPMADGPVIQRASERALKLGVGLADVLQCVREFRINDTVTPLVLMGYANPIEHMGIEVFVPQAAQAGVDGVLVVDYPPEECLEFTAGMKAHGLDTIFLLAPTSTSERIEQVAKIATGYVYYVSLKGVTGTAAIDLSEVNIMMPKIRQHVTVPVAIGFGIRDAATAKLIAGVSDAVVIGSRIIQIIEAHQDTGAKVSADDKTAQQLPAAVQDFIQGVRNAMDS